MFLLQFGHPVSHPERNQISLILEVQQCAHLPLEAMAAEWAANVGNWQWVRSEQEQGSSIQE